MEKPKLNTPLKFVHSNSREITEATKDIIKQHNAQIHQIGGSGIKIALVAKGNMDAMLYFGACNHKWDTCAGESLILALGGAFSSTFGDTIEYDP